MTATEAQLLKMLDNKVTRTHKHKACKLKLLCETKTRNVLTRNDNDKHYDYNTNDQPHLKETSTEPVNRRVEAVGEPCAAIVKKTWRNKKKQPTNRIQTDATTNTGLAVSR